MKRFILFVTLFVFVTVGVSWAIKAELPRDGGSAKIQVCSPTLGNGVALTGNSQTLNVTDATCWRVYVASDTKFRIQSTATKVGVQHTIPGGSWYTEAVSNYKYVNFSSTAGTFRSDKP